MMPVDRKTRYQQMRAILNEKQWRQFLALEAQERGSLVEVAQDAEVSKNTVRRGLEEIEGGEHYPRCLSWRMELYHPTTVFSLISSRYFRESTKILPVLQLGPRT